MSASERKTISVTGMCPITDKSEEIIVTYKKTQSLTDPQPYATVLRIKCPNISSCTFNDCPIACSHIYW